MPRELQIIRFYQSLRNRPPTFIGLARRNLPRQAVLVAVFFVLIVLTGLLPFPVIARLIMQVAIGSFCAGAIVRDMGYVRRVLQSWPILAHVIDWNKVDALEHKWSEPPKRP